MYEHGLKNSVATLGIATNRFHIQKLLQVVDQIIFCFDGDDAGGSCLECFEKCFAINY